MKSSFGADSAWAGVADPAPHVKVVCTAFTSLGSISARFAARLVRAGALTALMRLGDKALAQRMEAAGQGVGAGAGIADVQTYDAVVDCIEAFAPFVPQVGPRSL